MQETMITDTEILIREITEIDRVLHRVRARLQGLPKKKSQLEHWREMRGILMPHLTVVELCNALRTRGESQTLRAKLPEDPVAWQRKLRSESERHRAKLLAPYLKSMRARRP